jgi:hypothetical protein
MKALWVLAAAASLTAPFILAGCTIATETAAPKPVAATAPSAGAPTPSDPAAALRQWRTRSAAAVASMQDAMRDLGIAIKAADYPAIQANCHKVGDAANAIASALPSPDTRLTAAFDTAVHSFSAATAGCGIWVPGVTDEQANSFMGSMHVAIDQMDTAMFMMSG